MAFANTSAATWPDFVAVLTTFLTGAGWSVAGTNVAPIYTNANGMKFNMRMREQQQYDAVLAANFTDRYVQLWYDKSSIGLPAGDSRQFVESNDWIGPLANIWFFGTGSYVNIVVQSAPGRYSHLSFGEVDPKGIHEAHVPFIAGKTWYFWPTNVNPNAGDSYLNYPDSFAHRDDMLSGSARVGMPTGLLDPALLFPAVAYDCIQVRQINERELGKRTDGPNNPASWLDYHCCIQNKAYTGGIIVGPMPVFVMNSPNTDVHAYIGEFPDIGLVNMDLLSPAQIINFGDDEWQVFPQKQYGQISTCRGQANPQLVCNTWTYGFAFKRVA